MNISYNWLKNYININVSPEQISKILTSIGLEVGSVEQIQTVKGGLEGLVVGEVFSCAKHENSDHLHVTTVNVGQTEPLQIVCGAPNVDAGQKVIVATVGTKLYSGDDCFTIKRSKIRGVESFGMICAEDEIGIGTDHNGIMVLPEDTEVGMLAKDYFGIKDDTLIEVDITPNRIDAASHYGVARDLAAYFALIDNSVKLTKPSVDTFRVENTSLSIPVVIENTAACPRYSAITISGVTVTESPKWLKDNLLAIGLRPINNIVDITNFILHELGQPLHAFDADKITTGEVRVKNLPEGTPFTTLDGVERKLSSEDLMICNGDEPMCIGGVFGGLNSGVTEATRNVFLESAYFNPVSIRKTARRHGLNTDASFRFERGCDPEITIYALKRAALLIQEIAGGTISCEPVDEYPVQSHPFDVTLNKEKIDSLIGKKIGRDNIVKILNGLEIEIVSENEEQFQLKVPAYRVDVQRDVDVIEDILRIYGYNNVEIGDKLVSTLSYASKPDSHKLQILISEQLTAQGFNEVLNNSLTKGSYYNGLTAYPETESVKLLNPLSSDLNVMRQTLLFGGLENIARNINYRNSDLKLYEFGNCYHYHNENKNPENPLDAYTEEYHLGMWITGNKFSDSWTSGTEKSSFYELKAYVQNILTRFGLNLRTLKTEEFADDLFAEALRISSAKGTLLVTYGIVNPEMRKRTDVNAEVYYADLVWNNILSELKDSAVKYSELPKYPEVRRDLAFLLDKNTTFAEIEKIAYESERKFLKKVSLFDVYEGKNLGAGKKSYAVCFILQDESKTMTDNVIDGIMRKIQQNIETKLNAKLRS
ncbi:MAG TPA: phenylalanine--tRNA ligase subunit beta [Paludibacteraceae bacterium]|nr:phenylalanine--tRNA ligase subunit beta [Paludibacteraceae bacterium]